MNLKDFNIQKFIDIDYVTDDRKSRRKGSGGTQEFFTPFSVVEKMCLKIPEEDWQDPTKTFLEPCFGNGNFIVYIIWNRIHHGIDWQTALKTLYGVELVESNIQEARQRIHELLRNIAPDYDPEVANKIMDKNLVCSDFFKWDFEHWRPLEEKHKYNFK